MHFVLCSKQGNKIEGVACPKQGQGFQTISGSPIPKYWSSTSTPRGIIQGVPCVFGMV